MSCFGASCTALGSLCECTSFSLDSLCNCSKTQTIIIPRANIENIIKEGLPLKEILEKSYATSPLAMSATVRRITIPLDEEADYVDRSIQAIELIGGCTINRWMKKVDHFEENWARFESSYRLAKINLDDHITERRPLLEKEMKKINQKIEEIERYGSIAADLLEKVCACKGNWESLKKTLNVSAGTCKFLSERCISADFKNSVLFSKLAFTIQAIFIEAVKKSCSKNYLKEHAGDFTAWVKQEKDGRKVEEEKRSPLTEVQHRLTSRFAPTIEDSSLEAACSLLQINDDKPFPETENNDRHFTFVVPTQATAVASKRDSSSHPSRESSRSSKERPRPSTEIHSANIREGSHSAEHKSRGSSKSPQAHERRSHSPPSPTESRQQEDDPSVHGACAHHFQTSMSTQAVEQRIISPSSKSGTRIHRHRNRGRGGQHLNVRGGHQRRSSTLPDSFS